MAEEGLAHMFNKPPLKLAINYVDTRGRGDSRGQSWQKQLEREIRQRQSIHAVFAVIPQCKDRDQEEIYAAVKRVCSAQFGIASQCVLEQHAENGHVVTGIMRQMLTKLGSIPWLVKFELPDRGMDLTEMMLVGLDVNHDRRNTQSTIGLAASFDRDFVKYWTQTSYQELAQDMIQNLEKHIGAAIDNFHKMNGIYPKKIMIWRDGVSATQIEELSNTEIKALEQGINQKYREANLPPPKWACIVVQKRIVHRFTCSDSNDSAPPGTLVAKNVTSNQYWDYFLVSCEPPERATATPTRYIVVKDVNMNLQQMPNDLYFFTNQLCNMYFNWPGPIRVPAPVKYANKLAQQFGQSCNSLQPHQYLRQTYHFL